MNEVQKRFHSMACAQVKKLSAGRIQPNEITNLAAVLGHLAAFAANPAAFAEYYVGKAPWALGDDLKTANYAAQQLNPKPNGPPPTASTATAATADESTFDPFRLPPSDVVSQNQPAPKIFRIPIRTRLAMTSAQTATESGVVGVVSIDFGGDFQRSVGQIHWFKWDGRLGWRLPHVTVIVGNTERRLPVFSSAVSMELVEIADKTVRAVEAAFGEAKPGMTYIVPESKPEGVYIADSDSAASANPTAAQELAS